MENLSEFHEHALSNTDMQICTLIDTIWRLTPHTNLHYIWDKVPTSPQWFFNSDLKQNSCAIVILRALYYINHVYTLCTEITLT